MKISILKECGYSEALLGLSLSYGISLDRAKTVAQALSKKDYGHNKFLESIYVWFDITAPRFWWQQADTYRLSTKQSESTMHTLLKKELTQSDFEYPIPEELLQLLNNYIAKKQFVELKNILPEGFLQRRVWVVNYKTLRNIYIQRKDHKLEQWKIFCDHIANNLEHKEFLGG